MPKSNPNILGLNLRRIRLEAGLRQEDVAERMGVSRAYVAQIEKGDRVPTTRTAGRIADALGVGVGALLAPQPNESPIAPLLDEFRQSPYFAAMRPTEEELRWLAGLERSFWSGVPASEVALVNLLKARRGML